MVKSQIKYWVFGCVGAIGAYLTLLSIFGDQRVAVGLTLIAACIGCMILGGVWDHKKEGEDAATFSKLERDERARQSWRKAQEEGAKLLEAPKAEPAE